MGSFHTANTSPWSSSSVSVFAIAFGYGGVTPNRLGWDRLARAEVEIQSNAFRMKRTPIECV